MTSLIRRMCPLAVASHAANGTRLRVTRPGVNFTRGVHHGVRRLPFSAVTLSPEMVHRATRGVLEDIDLMVCDMAGTTVQEGGIVYKTLRLSMQEYGLKVSEEEMAPWHGAKKESVIEHFIRQAGRKEEEIPAIVETIGEAFVGAIDEAYFQDASPIDHIDITLMKYFQRLKAAGVKIALDTGYPQNIQEGLVKKMNFDKVVDSYISSYDVAQGRPYPYMIHNLMERLDIMDVRRVAKVGDSVRDIEMGRNAGCGLVVGVLSGADGADALFAAGADVVCNTVTDLPVPKRRFQTSNLRIPDLS